MDAVRTQEEIKAFDIGYQAGLVTASSKIMDLMMENFAVGIQSSDDLHDASTVILQLIKDTL